MGGGDAGEGARKPRHRHTETLGETPRKATIETGTAKAEIEKPPFIGRFSRVGGRDEKREKWSSPFRYSVLVGGEGLEPPTLTV